MLLITALIVSGLFVLFCRNPLRKHPYPFYIGAAVLSLVAFLGDFSGSPVWLDHMVISLFSRGALGTGLFSIVMYMGVLKNLDFLLTISIIDVKVLVSIIDIFDWRRFPWREKNFKH